MAKKNSINEKYWDMRKKSQIKEEYEAYLPEEERHPGPEFCATLRHQEDRERVRLSWLQRTGPNTTSRR